MRHWTVTGSTVILSPPRVDEGSFLGNSIEAEKDSSPSALNDGSGTHSPLGQFLDFLQFQLITAISRRKTDWNSP